ncbi:hypothetical protein SUGI_0951330 [Cryptomeria japonica]|nr:hypothetical protein SUGI_0951330 [Cryptomeria japonica]
MASTAIFSGHILTRCAQLPPPNKRNKFPVKVNKINEVSISYLKLKPERGSECRIRASDSSSVSASPGKMPDVLSEDVESSLAMAEVFDLSGKAVRLTDLWKERKAVVGFARHFGCVLCRKRADILASQKGSMDAAGVALVLIGPGSIDQAKEFAKQTQFPGEVYADPSHSTFDALKFVSGVSTTFTPLAGMKIIESYLQGYRQDWRLSFQKETVNRGSWQQGGILVAGPGENNIVYLHKDREAGDDPDVKDVLKACCTS